jgi:hypothetical protein
VRSFGVEILNPIGIRFRMTAMGRESPEDGWSFDAVGAVPEKAAALD